MRLIPRSDARLAKLAAAGDERAFAAIYERYHQELYRYCRAILGDSDEAQDALQGTMASALRSLPGESRLIELRPWLYRVAHNEAISILRRRQPLAQAHEPQLPREPAVDAVFESRERLRELVADLATLPERQRSALVMRELSGLSHQQIATALGTSDGAARQVVYEARQALQELEEGRAMECERVRQVLSDGDRRVLRGRGLRAHLRGCQNCRDFQAGIETRTAELQLLAPPLSTVAASGVLASVVGSGSAGAGAGALAAGGLGGGAIGAKALGLIAASAAIGIGAGTVGGIDLPGAGPDDEPGARIEPAVPAEGAGSEAAADAGGGSGATTTGGTSAGAGARGGPDRGSNEGGNAGNGSPPVEPGAQAPAASAAPGASASAPAGAGQPATPPGSGVAEDRSGGHSATPTTGPPENAAEGLPAHSNAGGVSDEHGKPEKQK